MTHKRFVHVLARVGLVAAILTHAFWIVWSLYAPVPSSSVYVGETGRQLTVPISRWFDAGFVYLAINIGGWAIRGAFTLAEYCERRGGLRLVVGYCAFIGTTCAVFGSLSLTPAISLMRIFPVLLGIFVCGLCALGAIAWLLFEVFKLLLSYKTWQNFGNWLIAADKKTA